MSDSGRAVMEEDLEVQISKDAIAAEERKEWVIQMRGWMTLLATLVASVTYQAGLSPPGGFWQDSDGHVAGDPVLHDGRSAQRYLTFYYFNATAFVTSLVIFIMLLDQRFHRSQTKVAALTLTTALDLISFVVAYIAGSSRNMPDSVYIIVFTCFLFACVVYFTRMLPTLCFMALFVVPPLYWLAAKGWLPVTEHMKMRVVAAKYREREEEEKRRPTHARRNRCFCCSCCRSLEYDDIESREAA